MASARVCLLTRLLFIVFGIAPGLLHTAHFPLADAFAAVDKRTEAVGGQVKKKGSVPVSYCAHPVKPRRGFSVCFRRGTDPKLLRTKLLTVPHFDRTLETAVREL